jgi:BirA family transcriptional regulator, biotin operon repressor / biotin---[acetyl-CoA-carboxylase] ligase
LTSRRITMLERFLHSEIDSTNVEAGRLWKSGRARRCLVAATRQTGGKGRYGRTWDSPTGGLWFSLLWPAKGGPEHYQGVSLSVGLAAAEAIDQVCDLSCAVKWPNDLLVRGRKLAGILCQLEASGSEWAIVAGVGINANFEPAILGPDLEEKATSILEETGRATDLGQLMEACAERICSRLEQFEAEGFKAHIASLQGRLAWRGDEVEIIMENPARGRLVGVNERGHLVLDCEGELRTFISGELSGYRRLRGISYEG